MVFCVLNFTMITIDTILYFRNVRFDRTREAGACRNGPYAGLWNKRSGFMELKNQHREDIDPMAPMLPAYYGTFERTVEIGGQTRRFLYYVPDGVTASTSGVMLLPPDGMNAEEFLERSNWKMLCETEECKEKFILCILEPGGGGWQNGESYDDPEGDVAYIHSVYQEFSRRNLFCVHESRYYLVGYGGGAAAAQRAALSDPAAFAGLACVDSRPVDADFRARSNAAVCRNLDGFEDPAARQNLRKEDIPLPVWMISSSDANRRAVQPDLENWCARCGAVPVPGRPAPDTTAYVREAAVPYPDNQDREAYRVWSSLIPEAGTDLGERVNRRIWKDFLCRVRRWMSEPGGSLRMSEDPIRDLGCEYHYELAGGWMREWYVYVPKQVREHPEHPAPVVFACHGYTCTGEIYLGNSGWNRVADRFGFLVAAPTAPFDRIEGKGENQACKFDNTQLPAWNIFGKPDRPDEIAFFLHMLEDLRSRYSVDLGRVYATGHSWGSMMTQYLGMALPHLFAAIAPCSGVLFDEHDETLLRNPRLVPAPDADMPVWMFVGEMEPWLFPCIPEGENAPARSIRLWWNRNRMAGPAPQDFTEGWQVSDRWHDLIFPKNGCPLLRYTWVDYLPHATMPEMSARIWREFFSKVHRNPENHALCWEL